MIESGSFVQRVTAAPVERRRRGLSGVGYPGTGETGMRETAMGESA